jgi:hypothetical protein
MRERGSWTRLSLGGRVLQPWRMIAAEETDLWEERAVAVPAIQGADLLRGLGIQSRLRRLTVPVCRVPLQRHQCGSVLWPSETSAPRPRQLAYSQRPCTSLLRRLLRLAPFLLPLAPLGSLLPSESCRPPVPR